MASAAYERRNARARALGYRSYYDYRAHDNGKIPPAAPRLRGEALRRARGHAGAADLTRAMRPGALITATPDPTSRRTDGTYARIHVTVIGEDGSERDYMLRTATLKPGQLDAIIAAAGAAGAVFSPSPSLDLAALLEDVDDYDDDDEYDDDGEYDFSYDDIPF